MCFSEVQTKTRTINQPFSITPSDAGLICSKATNHTNHCFYCFMPFTSFCLFLSLSLSHFSLLLSFSLDFLFFFLVLFKDSIHSIECPGTNTGVSQRARTPISLPLCGDLFSLFFFLANFQPASTSHLHSNDTAKETLAKAASSVQVFTAAWRKIAASDLGRLERFDQWSLFLQNFGAQLQFYLSRGTVRRWLGFLPYVFTVLTFWF